MVPTEYLVNEKHRQSSCVSLLLKAGADVNNGDVHGNTAIGHAAYFGEDHLIDPLVKAGANVNTSGNNGITPLFLAAQAGRDQCLEKLIYAGAYVNAKTVNGFTSLMQAILTGHVQCANTLITAGADVNTAVTLKPCQEDIVKTMEAGMATVSSYLVGDDVIDELKWKVENQFADLRTAEVQFTCLGIAEMVDMEKSIPSLLEAGANVNVPATLRSPLLCAADQGQTKVLNYLIRSGAEVNYQYCSGSTALHSAARNGHIDCVKRLVKSRVDLNKRDINGHTPLMIAAINGYDNCVIQLVEAGADVDIADDMGNTALMGASMADHWKCASALLGEGADVNKENNHGDVPLMCAARKGDDQWLRQLKETGADVNVINKLGENAFTIARNKKNEDCIRILVHGRVDLNIPDLCSKTDHKDRVDNKRSATTDILHPKEEDLDIVDSVRISLTEACTVSNETEDPEVMPPTSCEPQFVVEMFEEEPVTVECGVHSGVKRSEV